MNAHVGLDKRNKISKAGDKINYLVSHNSYSIMNDDSPTYFSTSKNTTSCIDLCLVKLIGTSSSCKWKTGDSFGSDHIVTTLEIDHKYKAESKIIEKIDWAGVRQALNDYEPIFRCNSVNEIESSIEAFSEHLRQTVNKNSLKKKILTRNDIALSKETVELINFRRRLNKLRKYNDSNDKSTDLVRKVMNYLNREIKRLIKRDVEKTTATKVEALFEEKDAAKSWKMLKEIEPDIGKKQEEASCCGIEDDNGVLQKDDATVAKIHAERLEIAHSFPNNPKFDDTFRQKIEDDVKKNLPTDATDFGRIDENLKNEPVKNFIETEKIGRFGRKIPPNIKDNRITANEIFHHLRKKKNRSSGGDDGVNYKLLKHTGKNAICGLAKLFTILLVAGYFPMNWRSVRISMIPKPGKNLKVAKNWRPISLSSCISKIFETCIKERLQKEMVKRKVKENHFQAAYKKGRSCDEHVLRLEENVAHGFANQASTVAVFLDVAGAFDKVWTTGLLWKLMKLQLPKHLIGVINGFISNRSLRVKVGPKLSPPVYMKAGTPQGAVLSPSLFNIFVDDLRDAIGIDKEVFLGQYADDIAIWTTDKDPKSAEKRINETLEKIAKWTAQWRVQLAPEKSVFILFSRKPTHRRMDIDLKLLGSNIARVSSHRFLGVEFDERLDWKSHVTKMIGKATPRIHAIKRLAAKSIWRNPTWILKLHESVVTSIWRFGAIAYANMSVNLWEQLTKCHSRSVKAYCGLPNFVSYNAICDQLGIKQIKDELLHFGKKRLLSIATFSPFGPEILSNRRAAVSGLYKSSTEILLNDADVTDPGNILS